MRFSVEKRKRSAPKKDDSLVCEADWEEGRIGNGDISRRIGKRRHGRSRFVL